MLFFFFFFAQPSFYRVVRPFEETPINLSREKSVYVCVCAVHEVLMAGYSNILLNVGNNTSTPLAPLDQYYYYIINLVKSNLIRLFNY